MSFGKGQRVGKVTLTTADGKPVDGSSPADPPADPPPESKPETQPEPPNDEPDKAASSNNHPKARSQKMPNKPNNKPNNRKPSRKRDENFEARVRRAVRSEKKRVWEALGLEGDFDETKLGEKVDELLKAREENKSAIERFEGRASTLEEKMSDLKAELSRVTKERDRLTNDLKGKDEEISDMQVEHELREHAWRAGIKDPDYAIELLRRHARDLPEEQDPDVPKFFEDLKQDKSKRYLFEESSVAAGPKSAAEQQAAQQAAAQQQQQSQQPGQQGAPQGQQTAIPDQGAPKPAEGGEAEPKQKGVMEMNSREFAAHTDKNYDYRPGMA